MKQIERLKIENAQLKERVLGQEKELVLVRNHLDDLRVLVNRFTEGNVQIKYSPIQKGQE